MTGKRIISVEGGRYFSLALASDGTVYCYGENDNGQCGQGSGGNAFYTSPVAIPGASSTSAPVISIAAGDYHVVALRSDGTGL